MARTVITVDVYKAGQDVPVAMIIRVQIVLIKPLIVLKQEKNVGVIIKGVEILDTVLIILRVTNTVLRVVPHVPVLVTKSR